MRARPRQVSIALALMLGALMAHVLVSLLRLLAVPSDFRLVLVPGIVIGLLVRLALIDLVARRKNWARFIYVILVGLWLAGGVSADVMNALDGTWQGAASLAPLAAGVLLSAAAALLLVLNDANAWFRVAPVVDVQTLSAVDGEWFYREENVTRGPVSQATLRGMLREGELGAESFVWTAGMGAWQQATIALGQHAAASGMPFEQAHRAERQEVD